jgi:hypothetical protein
VTVDTSLPLILIEGVLVFGGALVFGWWQLRSVERDRLALLRRREREHEEEARVAAGPVGSASDRVANPDGTTSKGVNAD